MTAISRFLLIPAIISSAFLFMDCSMLRSKHCNEWVVKINDEEICKEDMDREYDAYVSIAAQNKGMTKDEFLKFIYDDKEMEKQPRMMLPQLLAYRKENFQKMYIQNEIFYAEAKKTKIIEDKKLQALLNFQRKMMVKDFMLLHILKGKINITDDDVEKYYEKNRTRLIRRFPAMRQAPISQVLEYVRDIMVNQKREQIVLEKSQEIRDRNKIEINKAVESEAESSAKKESDNEPEPEPMSP